MLYNKILLVPYKHPKCSNIDWYIKIAKKTSDFKIGPFASELLAGQFMDSVENRYCDFMIQLSKFAEEL